MLFDYISATTRAIEVTPEASNLNSGDAFVVISANGAYLWFGKGASASERETAKKVAQRLASKVTEVSEGSETDDFWSLLGGKATYASDSSLYEQPREPRLFWGSNASGSFKVEEIFNFTQDDLAEDDVFILDTYNEVYVWVGSGSNDVEKKMALETAVVCICCCCCCCRGSCCTSLISLLGLRRKRTRWSQPRYSCIPCERRK